MIILKYPYWVDIVDAVFNILNGVIELCTLGMVDVSKADWTIFILTRKPAAYSDARIVITFTKRGRGIKFVTRGDKNE